MVSLLLLLVLPTFTLTTQPTEQEILDNWFKLIEPYESVCACESGATLADIHQLWENFDYPQDKPCLKCYMRCIYEKLGLIDLNNNVIKSVYLQKVLGSTEAMYNSCTAKTSNMTDTCKKFYEFDYCISYEMSLVQ